LILNSLPQLHSAHQLHDLLIHRISIVRGLRQGLLFPLVLAMSLMKHIEGRTMNVLILNFFPVKNRLMYERYCGWFIDSCCHYSDFHLSDYRPPHMPTGLYLMSAISRGCVQYTALVGDLPRAFTSLAAAYYVIPSDTASLFRKPIRKTRSQSPGHMQYTRHFDIGSQSCRP
jgi:hypothetical protein